MTIKVFLFSLFLPLLAKSINLINKQQQQQLLYVCIQTLRQTTSKKMIKKFIIFSFKTTIFIICDVDMNLTHSSVWLEMIQRASWPWVEIKKRLYKESHYLLGHLDVVSISY